MRKIIDWLWYKRLVFFRYFYYRILAGGYENNVKRMGGVHYGWTLDDANRKWKHHNRFYTIYLERKLNGN